MMPKLLDSREIPSSVNDEKSDEQERLDRAADELAQQASKTEQAYDENHDLFTK